MSFVKSLSLSLPEVFLREKNKFIVNQVVKRFIFGISKTIVCLDGITRCTDGSLKSSDTEVPIC